MSEMDLSKLKVADLKKELKNKGLSTVGNKNELIERLQGAAGGKDSWLLETELDHDEDLLDEDELLKDEDELLNPSPERRKAGETTKSTTEPPTTPTSEGSANKKVSLKRNHSISILPAALLETSKSDEILADDAEDPPKKTVKLSQLTLEERKKARAEKFGSAVAATAGVTAVVSDEKKSARAARFGITAPTTETNTANAKVDIEVLKKRAERFGATTATQLNKIEQEEKLKKRQERFGAAATTTVAVSGDMAEKARQRLERFKTAA